eukprot:Nk52_evm47s152 gene=Nk52_evmTU47s152
MDNANPELFSASGTRELTEADYDDEVADEIDAREVFDLIRNINDPEHPHSLEELNVARLEQIHVDDAASSVRVEFTPTIPHCSLATLIGLCIQVRLLRSLPSRFKTDVLVSPGSHAQEAAVNKQLGDKERVAAALENKHLLEVVNQCLCAKG